MRHRHPLVPIVLLALATHATETNDFSLQGFIDEAVKTGATRIVVPPGRYRVAPKNHQHLVLRGLKDVEIVATGVEMVCTETTRALTIGNCTNVTLRGLVIDYDPLPFTQGRITGFAEDRKVHEIELFDGYPAAAEARAWKYEIFRPDTRTLRCDDRDPERIEAIDARHLRLHLRHARATDPEQVGDLVVLASEHAPGGSAAHAVYLEHSTGVVLEDVDLYASNCFGFLEDGCNGTVYRRCRIDRRAPDADPVKRADPRLRSLNADAYHSKHAVKGPSYLSCTARFMGDDAININGDYHLVMASSGAVVRVLAKHRLDLTAGDPVELVAYDGVRLPDAVVVAVETNAAIADDERAFLAKQHLDERLRKADGMLNRGYRVALDRAVDLPRGSVIAAANKIGNGFAVRDCTFGFNRSRGILIKASGGEVTGNRIEGSRMSGILVSPEYWWLEAGSSSDVAIRDNMIEACGGIGIRVEATGGTGAYAPAGAHRNIVIERNRIANSPAPGILVTSTAGLTLRDNSISLLPDTNLLDHRLRRAGVTNAADQVTWQCE